MENAEWKKELREQAAECNVPEHTIEPMVDYIVDGLEPGGFLCAFLENDLIEAIGRADHINARAFKEIATFIYTYAPSACHGSVEKMGQWVAHRREAQRAAAPSAPGPRGG